MGKTCKLKDVSFQCMTKFTTNKKKKKEKRNPNTAQVGLPGQDDFGAWVCLEGDASPRMTEASCLVPSETCPYALFPVAGSDLYSFAIIKLQ